MSKTNQITPLVSSTDLRVWGSKNATASHLPVVNSLQVPLWKPTELQINLASNHGVDSVLFEIVDQTAFASKLFISPEMSVAILNNPSLTAGQLKRAAPVSSLRPSFRSSINDNIASAVLIPDFKEKEICSKPRFISVLLTRGSTIVAAFMIEYRIYSKHSGTRSALLLNPAPGTAAYRAAKAEKTNVQKKPSFKASRTTTKKTTTPVSAVSNNTVRIKTAKTPATPSSDQENLDMPLTQSEAEYFSSFSSSSSISFCTMATITPLSYDDVLSVADVIHCDDSYSSSSPSSETDSETYSESSSSCADEEFARRVMESNDDIDIHSDEYDDRPLQDSTPFLTQISV